MFGEEDRKKEEEGRHGLDGGLGRLGGLSECSGGGTAEAGVGFGDVEGNCSIGKDACVDEVGGAEVAERRRQEAEEDPARDRQGLDGGGGGRDVDGDGEKKKERCE